MAQKKKDDTQPEEKATEAQAGQVPRPRLRKLRISNFRCIGARPVEVELDDIVVLVGPNNVGKSAILRAYELIMQEGSMEGEMPLSDFPREQVDASAPPTIELETVVYDEAAPGSRWVARDPATGELVVKERWRWLAPGKPERVGWDVAAGDWHPKERPWGAPNVAQAARPEPHYVDAFASPEDQSKQIVGLLHKALQERVKNLSANTDESTTDKTVYESLLDTVKILQRTILDDTATQIDSLQSSLSSSISEVFPGYAVVFDARPEDDVENCIQLFKNQPQLRMGPVGGHQPPVERQGSGARRTLLWTALRILAEENRQRATKPTERPHLLLLDEPEICLHPNAIREACRVLYDLPRSGKWQVMVTTHSPQFIDLSRDNTSIVRVELADDGAVQSTTLYRPQRAKLDDDDRKRLKLLNIFDPYVAEFFFGGKTVLVEGDTEYTAFMHLVARFPGRYKGLHVVRARGKSTLASLAKILNQFGKPYAVLHDADRPFLRPSSDGTRRRNPAWTVNETIRSVVASVVADVEVRLVASVPNFEEAFLGRPASDEKPYEALMALQQDGQAVDLVAALLDALVEPTNPLPPNALAWNAIETLKEAVAIYDALREVASAQENT